MAAALGTWTSLSQSKPLRIEGHTSNVEGRILYKMFISGTVGETVEAGDTYIIPHKFDNVEFINLAPLDAEAVEFLYGDATTLLGSHFSLAASVAGPTQITTVATAGASTVVLTSGTAIDDVYNGCFVDIRYSDGSVQTVKVTDYVGATALATIDQPLSQSIAATGTNYVIKGSLLTTITSIAVTPSIAMEVSGSFV